MATTAEIQVPVIVYGVRTTQFLLAVIIRLSPWLGGRLSVWLANRLLAWLLWAKIGTRWIRLNGLSFTAEEEK